MRAWEVSRACCEFQFGSLFQWLQHVDLGSMLKAGFWASACFTLSKWNGQHKALYASPAQGWHLSSMVPGVCAEHIVHLVLHSGTGYLFSVEVTLLIMLPWCQFYEYCPHPEFCLCHPFFISDWSGVTEVMSVWWSWVLSVGVCVLLKLLYSVSASRKASQTLPKWCENFWCSPLLNDV